MTTYYTTPEQVVSFLRLTGNDGYRLMLDETSDPTRGEVEGWINQAEAYIERMTNHAWRTMTVTNEYHNLVLPYDHITPRESTICLNSRDIQSLDHLYIFNGTTEDDWKVLKVEGRGDDYYLDYKLGIIYLRGFRWFLGNNQVRVDYKYGSTCPYDIQRACTLLTAITWVQNDYSRSVLPEGVTQTPSKAQLVEEMWRHEANQIIKNHTTMLTVLR
jgi:hypothetical protein